MRRLTTVLFAFLTFALVLGGSLLKKTLPVALCGLLSFNSAVCAGLGNGSQVLAKPPIIRTEADLVYDLADDFAIAQQTPHSTGRNEVLISSASTGAEQRFWTSLPGTGSFKLFELELTKIQAKSAESLIRRTGAPVSAVQVQDRFSRVKAEFSNNQLSSIAMADGSKAEFSQTQAVLKNADGSVAAMINATQSAVEPDPLLATKGNEKLRQLVAQSKSSCESQTAVEIVQVSSQVQQWSKAIASQWKPNMDWQDRLTQGVILEASRALASSLKEATSGSVALQKTSCRQPLKCGQRRDTQAENIPGNSIITDLFRVPPGAQGNLALEYEFFEVPDRIEVSYDGKIQYAVGPTSGSNKKTFSLAEVRQGFVGIRVIGNPDSGTEWWYEIACEGKGLLEDLLARLEETSGKIHELSDTNSKERGEIEKLQEENRRLSDEVEMLSARAQEKLKGFCQAIDERPFDTRPAECNGIPSKLDFSVPEDPPNKEKNPEKRRIALRRALAVELIDFGVNLLGNTLTVVKNKRSLQLIFNSLKANLEKQSSNESAIENFKELIEKNQNSMESYATLAYRDYISVIKNSDVISEHRSGYYNSRTLKPFIPESLMFTMILDVKERIRVSGTQGA